MLLPCVKSSHFDPVCKTHQAPSVSRVYINEILRLPDLPKDHIRLRISIYKTILD
jgi:hypothetical protein